METFIAPLVCLSFAFVAIAGIFAIVVPRYNPLAQAYMALGGIAAIAASASYFIAAPAEGIISIGNLFEFGAFSAFFFALIGLGTALTSIFAIGYLPRYAGTYSLRGLNTASALFVIGMWATVLANAPVVFLFSWEVMSVAAYFLVVADRSEASLKAGLLYFVVTQIGFFCLLSGFLLMADGALFAPWDLLRLSAETMTMSKLTLIFMLLFAGFGSKAGLVPLHQWLPYAHAQAPGHSSALLSGAMLSVALFGFLKASSLFLFIPFAWSLTVLAIGLLSALFGALHAAVENDAKRLLAYSSIEHMGLLFSAVGAYFLLPAAGVSGLALQAGMLVFIFFHVLNHLFFKAGLFMSVGAIISATHTRDLDLMGGLAKHWPAFSGIVLVLSLAAAALPPFGTFFGEWAYVQTLAVSFVSLPPVFAVGAGIVLALVALVAGLALFASIKMFSVVFLGRPRTAHAEKTKPMGWLLAAPPAACALALTVSGFVVFPLLNTSLFSQPAASVFANTQITGASINVWYIGIFVLAALIAATLIDMLTRRGMRTTGTWDCGSPLTPRMQYSSTGFAAPIRFFFRSLLVTRKAIIKDPVVPGNPWIAAARLDWHVHSIWEHWLYRTVGSGVLAAASFVRRLQNGVVQAYMLLVLATLIMTIIFAL